MTDPTPERQLPLRRRHVPGPVARHRPWRTGSVVARIRAAAALVASIDATSARTGIWRAAVAEESMLPALGPGDFLLLDPTTRRWPRRGSVVVIREPGSDVLAIKRIAARGGDHVALDGGLVHLDPDEAWLLGDAPDVSVDSRTYGPVGADRIVARAWLRYWPLRRIGRIR
jgi:signal peptidase I